MNESFKGENRREANDYIEKFYCDFYEHREKSRDGRAPKRLNVFKISKEEKRDRLNMTLEEAIDFAVSLNMKVTFTMGQPPVHCDNEVFCEQELHIIVEEAGKIPCDCTSKEVFIIYMENRQRIEAKNHIVRKINIFETNDKRTSWDWKLENLSNWLEKIGFRFDECKHMVVPLNKRKGESDYHIVFVDGFEPVKSIFGETGLIQGRIDWPEGKHFLEVTKRDKNSKEWLYYYLMPKWITEAMEEDEQINEIFQDYSNEDLWEIRRQQYWDDY